MLNCGDNSIASAMKNFGLAALLSAVASCFSLAAPGGTPGVAEDLSGDYYFKNISMQQGLSHTTVTSIIQDRRGFIWFGTHNGLNRFDGKMFRIYNSGNSDLERNFTSGLMEDSSGRLWVGTDDGIFLYNPDTDKIEKFKDTPEAGLFMDSQITCFVEDDRGNVWASAEKYGLFRISPPGGKVERQVSTVGKPNIYKFFMDGSKPWISY